MVFMTHPTGPMSSTVMHLSFVCNLCTERLVAGDRLHVTAARRSLFLLMCTNSDANSARLSAPSGQAAGCYGRVLKRLPLSGQRILEMY